MKHTVTSTIVCALLMSTSLLRAETLVNQRTSLDQKTPAAAICPDGRSLAVWNSYQQDGSSGTIVARWISADDVPDGNEWVINQQTTGNQSEPDIAINPQGEFLVTWQSPHSGGDAEDIIARKLDPNGLAEGDDFLVNQNTQEDQVNPAICARPDGSFVIVWESGKAPGQTKKAICGRIIDANGMPSGPELILSDTPTYECRYADVACTATGNFKVVWLENRSRNTIRLRSFLAGGEPQGASIAINSAVFKTLTTPAIDVTPKGSSVVVWDGDPNTGKNDDIHVCLLDPNDQPIGTPFIANQVLEGAQTNPTVTWMPDHDFIVAWESQAAAQENGTDISLRRYSSTGEALCDETIINQTRPNDQSTPVIASNSEGHYLLLWQSRDPNQSDWDIYEQAGPKLYSADLNADGQINFQDYALWSLAWHPPEQTSSDLYRDYRTDALDLWGFCQQWMTPPLD